MDASVDNAMLLTATSLELELKAGQDIRGQLINRINYLIQHDFNRLVSILYRIDVDEEKLKNQLRKFPATDAAEIMCDMMIERQKNKPFKNQDWNDLI